MRRHVERIALALEALESRIMLSTPTMQYISDSPDPVAQGGSLTLAAHRVVDSDDAVASVRFYRSTDAVFNAASDPLVGLATQGANPVEWSWTGTANWAAGVWYYFGVARDAAGNNSAPALTSGTVDLAPSIASLSGTPSAVSPGDTFKLTANGVTDADGSVVKVEFYQDKNNNGVWDVGDRFLGQDVDGSDGWWVNVLVQWTTGDYFARATDNAGLRSPFVKGHVDQKPVITAVDNDPNPVEQGNYVTFTATGVSDSDGTVSQVAFYRDVYDSGHYNPGFDQLLGYGTNMGGGTWALTVLANWQPDVSPMYFAVARDNEGYWGNAVWTLNQNPYVDHVDADPNPVALGETFDLQAQGVIDTDGYVNNVQFSVHTPTSWWPYDGTPTAEYQDSNGADNWTWSDVVVDWTITDMQQADFNQDGFLDLAVTVDVSSTAGPDFVSVLLNNGFGTFQAVSTVDLFQTGRPNYNPTSLATGDFNNDTYPDIAVADSAIRYVSVMLNDGTGHFNGYTDYNADFGVDPWHGILVHPDLIVAGDFTGDGNLDLIASSSADDHTAVLWGDGTGAFNVSTGFPDRVYMWGNSMWWNGAAWWNWVGPGEQGPQTAVNVQDMVSNDLDMTNWDPGQFGGADVAMVGYSGPLFIYNSSLRYDVTNKEMDYLEPGNVIGRSFETGLTGGVNQAMQFGFTYVTGNVWDFSQWGDRSRTDDFHHLWMHDGAVHMYHVHTEMNETITIATARILPPGSQPPAPPLYAHIYDAYGNLISTGGSRAPLPSGAYELSDTLGDTVDVTIGNAGDYYVAIAGAEIVSTDDMVDPFTGYWVDGDNLPSGGSDVEYYLRLGIQSLGGVATPPVGAGDSITSSEFMEDDYNRNLSQGYPLSHYQDQDVAISNSLTGEVTVLMNDIWVGPKLRTAYGGFFDYNAWYFNRAYDLGGHMPTSITAANIDGDLNRNTSAKPDWDWAQGSTGPHTNAGVPDEIYNDLITTNSDGSLCILLNTAEHSGNFAVHEYLDPSLRYNPYFDDIYGWLPDINYNVENNAFGGPFQSPIGVVVDDFNHIGLASIAVAEKYDIGFLRQGYPFFNSDPLDLNQYDGEIPQVGLPFDFAGRYSIIKPEDWQRNVMYYATAFDDDYGFPNNLQYEGYSDAVLVNVALNQNPLIWSLTPDRQTLAALGILTLTANGVQDLDGFVTAVQFYEYDGAGGLDPTQDTLLGTDNNGFDGWTWTGTLDGTSSIFYARAIDSDNAAGALVATHVNVAPTIAAIYVNGRYNTADDHLITGAAPPNGTLGIRGNVVFYDANANNRWDTGEEIWADNGNGNVYNGTQAHVYDGGDGTWDTPSGKKGVVGNLLFRDNVVADGQWTAGEAVWAQEILQDRPLILTAVDVTHGTGSEDVLAGMGTSTDSIRKVEFYRDSNYNGVFDPGIDYWMGRGTDVGAGRGTADHDWQFSVAHVDWTPGSQMYFAVAQDFADEWSVAAAGQDYVKNLPPNINGLTDSPDPVTKGLALTLTADGVSDPYGDVHSVSFYLDMNGDSLIDAGDTLLGIDESGADGWSFTGLVTWSGAPSYTYMARVTDNSGGTTEAHTHGQVNLPPTIGSMTAAPDPVYQMAELTLQALTVADTPPGSVTAVQFYRDSNGNGVLDVGVDKLLDSSLVQNMGGGTWQWEGTADWSLGDQLYFARALDDNGGWSQPVNVRGRVENPRPTIETLVREPDPVTQGYTLSLIAKQVQDSNGSIVKVEFYRDADGSGNLDTANDQLLGTVIAPIGQDFALDVLATWSPGTHLYFARALDNNDAWSDVAFVQGSVNGRPQVALLTADPNPLTPGDTLTLTATGVSDPDGTVQQVAFYRDTNADGIFQESLDALIGTDTNGTNGWSLAFADSTNVKTFFARSQDDKGGWSYAASVDVGRRPIIVGLTDSPDPVYPAILLHLTATDVSDIDGNVDMVQFYLDSNMDGVLQPGSDLLLGVDTTLADGWSLAINPTWGGGTWRYFARARDNDGLFNLDSHAPQTTGYVDFVPTATSLTDSPDPVTRGDNLTLTILGAADSDGTVTEAEFYIDTNGNGLIEPGVDTLLGRDTSSAGGWSLITSTAGWNTGMQTYLARVRDNLGAWSNPVSTTGEVNGRPVVGSLASSPEPVIRGGNLTLTASSVTDVDGLVMEVRFYRDANADGLWDAGDTFLGTGTSSDGTWALTVSTAGWITGDQTYFGRALDDDGAFSVPASVRGTVITVPSVLAVMQAASDTGVSQTDRITSDTTPTYDVTVNDGGNIKIDWDGDSVVDPDDVDQNVLLAGTYPYTPSPKGDGTYPVNVTFTDTALNVATTSAPTTIDTVAPATPGAPDLQASSDNGLSSTDNITSIRSPWFDVAHDDLYFRFYRNGTKISADYESGTTYQALSQPLGAWDYSLRAFDAAGNFSGVSPSLTVTFVTAPPAPVAPDLQPGSDSGISNTDNITNVVSPVFNVVPTDTYFRFYRNGVLISGQQTGTTFTAVSEPEGTWNYTVTSMDALGDESLQSAPLTVIIDRTAPTVTDPNISVVFSVDGGRAGIADSGDVLRITWDNSPAGDANTDVVSVAADMSQFAGPVSLAMYDDGTHGDGTAGDGIWTALHTIGPGTASPIANASIMATDRAGNVGTGHDTSNIPFVLKALATRQFGGVLVSLYDMFGNSGFDPANFIVTPGSNNSISSIKLAGTGSGQGIGITISGATSVGTISDGRQGLVKGDLSFIASNAPIKGITLKSGMTGMNLNGMSLGGLTFAADIDGDGVTSDLTAIYGGGAVQTVLTARGISGDVIIKAANSSGVSLSSFTTTVGGFQGDMIMPGSAGTITLGGNLSSEINVGGALNTLSIKGNMSAGAHVGVGGKLSQLKVTGSMLGGAAEDQMVQVLARNIGSVQVTGNITNSRILAGADLGDDWAVGGTGANADTFLSGSISSLTIGGSVSDSLIGAGLVSHDDAFDLAWLDANNAFIAGSVISKFTITGTLTSSVPLGPFGIGAYDIGSYKIAGLTIHPLVVSQI